MNELSKTSGVSELDMIIAQLEENGHRFSALMGMLTSVLFLTKRFKIPETVLEPPDSLDFSSLDKIDKLHNLCGKIEYQLNKLEEFRHRLETVI